MSQTLTQKFNDTFGDNAAEKLSEIAYEHAIENSNTTLMGYTEPDHSQDNLGSEPFRYVLLAIISFECVTHDSYRAFHNLDFINPVEFQLWVLDNADLKSFDGDYPDRLGVLTNAYGGYM